MKAKIRRGSGFRGVVDYALGKDEPRIVGGNMSSTIARDLAKEFGVSRALRPDIEKPVWHCSLSAAPGERLSDDQWQAIAERHMRGMGFSDATQFVVIKHTARDDQTNPPPDKVLQSGKVKKGGPETEHVHIIASRIGLDARIWLGQNDVHLAIEQTQQIEREFGLVETKGFDAPKDAKALTRAEAGMAERTGELAPREYLQTTLASIVADKPTMGEFIERAQAAGVELRPNLASTGRMNGFSFGYKDMNFSGSQLGASFKWASLQKSVDYQPERDNDKLRALLGQKPDAAAPAPAAPVADRPAVTAPAAPKAPTVAAPAPAAGRPAAPIPVAMPRSAAPAAARKTPAPRGATGRIRAAARAAMHGLAKWAQDSLDDMERIAKAIEKWRIRAQEIRAERERTVRAQRAAESRAALNARRQAPAPSPAHAGGSQPQPAAASREQLMERAAAARAAVEARRQASAPATVPVASRPQPDAARADLRPASQPPHTPPAAARPAGAAPAGDLERLRRDVDRAIANKGVTKSDALTRAAAAGDRESVDRLLDAGAAVLPKSLDAAAKSGRDDVFKKLVGYEGSATDAISLRELADKCKSPEAQQKLQALAAQAKAQGGHVEGLGIDGPATPGSSGPKAGAGVTAPKGSGT